MAPLPIPEAGMETDDIDDRLSEREATLPPIYTEFFPGASEAFGKAKTYMDLFDEAEDANARQTNLYYLFASQPEWELVFFLLKSGGHYKLLIPRQNSTNFRNDYVCIYSSRHRGNPCYRFWCPT